MSESVGRDIFDSLTLEDVTEPEAPAVPEASPVSDPTASAEAAAPATPSDPEASASPEAPATDATTATPAWTPPTGDPFSFKADGTEITLTGAVRTPDGGVYIPANTWESEFRPKWIANRDTWRQSQAKFEADLNRLRQENETFRTTPHPKAGAAEKLLKFLAEAPEQDVAAWVLERRQRLPMMIANAERDILLEQLNQRQTKEQEQARQVEVEDASRQLDQYLHGQVDAFLKEPDFALLASSPDEARALVNEFTERGMGGLFFKPVNPQDVAMFQPHGWQPIGTLLGKMVLFNPQAVRDVLEQRSAPLRRLKSQYESDKKVAQRNQAALKPTPAPPAPPPSRNTDGTFKKDTSSKMSRKEADAILNDLTLEQALAD